MKLKIAFIAVALFPAFVFAQQLHYKVVGKIGNYNSPAKVYLECNNNFKLEVDSATVKDGGFEFEGNTAAIKSVYLVLNPKGDGIDNSKDIRHIYLEDGIVSVTGNGSVANAIVTGTKTNEENNRYLAALKPVKASADSLDASVKGLSDQEQEKDAFKQHYDEETKKIELAQEAVDKKFITENPSSPVSLIAFIDYEAGDVDYGEMKPLFDKLSANLKETTLGKGFNALLINLKNVALGAVAPDFTEMTPEGKMVSLSSFRGKYVLVDFWASWCHPCRAENPNVVKAYNAYKVDNFTILGVSLDRKGDKDKWVAAIHKDGLTWTEVADLQFWDSPVVKSYGVKGIPQNFLLDPDGKIIAKNLHGNDLNKKLQELFKHN